MYDFKPRLNQLKEEARWATVDQWAFLLIVFLAGLFVGGLFLNLN